MYKGKSVLLMIPAYNEEGKIGSTLDKIPRDLVDEILVVDDGSRDKTVDEIKQRKATLISMEKNSGLGVVFKRAFKYALESKHDIGLIMGGDDQDDPTKINLFLQALVDEGYDMAQGSRYLGGTERIPLFRKVTTTLYSIAFSLAAHKSVSDASTGFKGFRISLLSEIDLSASWLDAKYGIEQYFLIQALKKGYGVKEIPVKKFFPKQGYSKMRAIVDWWFMLQPIARSLW